MKSASAALMHLQLSMVFDFVSELRLELLLSLSVAGRSALRVVLRAYSARAGSIVRRER